MYNRFDKNNNTKNGIGHCSIFSTNGSGVPIRIILNMTEGEYYLKYNPAVKNKPIISSTEEI